MSRKASWLLPALLLSAVPAQAADRATLQIRAEIQPFCKISARNGISEAGNPTEGSLVLGMVREVCNIEGGYRVRASFENLAGATVLAGGDQGQVDADGQAVFHVTEARAQTREWRLADVRRKDATKPVTWSLVISPI